MATISLRNYLREIEILIDQGKHEDAVKHSKHILKFFPKNIDTYRLLGKAYLENQRYSEAGDIFQRVLSVIPDDFIAQIGMSIIREDEGNLDAAIWHIERAFEVQPANAAIQDEIRRLYGRRDGIHLSKIRLSRGALIRMYLQGELYNQAIVETRTALAEDPQRNDLEVLLARLYYLSGRKVEAAETCSQILNKLPYCLEANKILSIILSSLDRSQEARVFQQRIYALEPYAAHITKNAPTIQQVPDNIVALEKLDLDFDSDTISRQPDWAQTIGIEVDQQQSEDILPDWLPSLTKEQLIDTGSTSSISDINGLNPDEVDLESLELGDEADLPEWMKSAGWNQTQKKTESEPEDLFAENGDLESSPAEDIPDWLKDIAPGRFQDEKVNLSDQQKMVWEDETMPVSSEEETDFTLEALSDANTTEQDEDQTDDLTAWLKTLDDETHKPESTASSIFADEPIENEHETMDLADFSVEEDDAGVTEVHHGLEEIDEAVQWLETIAEEQTSEHNAETLPEFKQEKTDEWVKEYENLPDMEDFEKEPVDLSAKKSFQDETVGPSEDEIPVEDPPSFAEITGLSELLQVTPDELPQETEEEDESISTEIYTAEVDSSSTFDNGFAWLEQLASRQGADEATLTTKPEDRNVEIPDWLSGLTNGITAPETAEEPEQPPEKDEDIGTAIDEVSSPTDDLELDLDAEFDRTIEKYGEVEEEEEEFIQEGTSENQDAWDSSEPSTGIEEAASKLVKDSIPENYLQEAHESLRKNDQTAALKQYTTCINNGVHLQEIIDHLQLALQNYPVDAQLWKILGDAYAKDNQLQKAIEAYTKAEELLY